MLRGAIMRRGYPTPKTGPIHCMVENVNMVVVNFDGVIYKCPAFVGNPDFAAGDVETGLRDYTETYQVGRWKTEECLECEYLPLCFGVADTCHSYGRGMWRRSIARNPGLTPCLNASSGRM